MPRVLSLVAVVLSLGLILLPPVKRLVRRILRALGLAGLRLRSRPLVLDDGPLLVVAPHPDDDTLGCGGLILLRCRAGLPTSVLYLTDGSASHPGHPELTPPLLAARRRAEAAQAAATLGLDASALSFFKLPDGRLPHLSAEDRAAALARLCDHLLRLAPATLLLPLQADGSSEHAAAHALVRDALSATRLAPRLLEFPVWALWQPARLFPLWRSARRVHRLSFRGDGATKRRALSAHATQLAPVPPWTRPVLPEDFAASFSREEEFFLEMPA